MIDNTSRYSYFKDNEAKVWRSRFEWHGEYGESSYPNCNIVDFLKENEVDFNEVIKAECSKMTELFSKINTLALKYVDWAFAKNKDFADLYQATDPALEGVRSSIKNHFIGSIGEFFFCFMLNDRKEFLLPYKIGDSIKTAFNFSNVSPRLETENDFGVDLVGDLEYMDKKNPCAIQVKFWNPASSRTKNVDVKEPMFTNEMASGVYTDAILNDYIDNSSDKSVVVCWTMKEKNISKWLIRNALLSSKMVFLDMTTLHNKIDSKSPEFWSNAKKKLNKIKTY